jgi:hypothetical protein
MNYKNSQPGEYKYAILPSSIAAASMIAFSGVVIMPGL